VPRVDLPRLFRLSSVGSQSRDGKAFRRRAAAGEFVKVRAGVYVAAADWQVASSELKHLIRVHAAVPRLSPRVVASHHSAAALHQVPKIGDWPEGVHVVDPGRVTAQVASGVHRHAGPLDPADVVTVQGLRATSVARTAVDLALTSSFRDAVVAFDHVLHRGSTTDRALRSQLDSRPAAKGRAGALRALEFADGAAESVGESWCRVVLTRLGAPVPVLQKAFSWGEQDMFADYVDFWFPDCGVVLEFDGFGKYTTPRWRRGRTPEQVVVDEKVREDRIRGRPEVRGFARAVWGQLGQPQSLATELRRAGVPLAEGRIGG